MAFTAISDILKYKEENNCKFWEAIVQQEAKDSLVDEKTVIDKMTKMYHNMNPFFEVEFGIGENENNDYEGVKYKNLYGTHVSGPILVRNPELLKMLVDTICKQNKIKTKDVSYKNEEEGYNLVLSELKNRKQKEQK